MQLATLSLLLAITPCVCLAFHEAQLLTSFQVIGEPGVDLNYEETVVYSNDAIRPAYIIVYGDAPPHKGSKLKAVIANLFKTPITHA
jgi:hypothetical protein